MSIDITQFYQVFFEEAAEHLATMESLLLGLDVSNPSLDELNAIFRSAHSIKGGSGTFGFEDMTHVTHILENLLDRLRKQEMKLTDEMVNVFLEAGDVIHMQLNVHRGEGSVDEGRVARVCEKLTSLTADTLAKAIKSALELAPASQVEPIAAPSGDYGFFDDEPASIANEVYGFFDEEPIVEAVSADQTEDDKGYGFFDEDPVTIKPGNSDANEAYGFFDEVPLPVMSPGLADDASLMAGGSPALCSNTSVNEEYGFFDDEPVMVNPPLHDQPFVISRESLQLPDDSTVMSAMPDGSEQLLDDPAVNQGYGMFVDEPTQFPSTPQQTQQEKLKGYGFFKKIIPVVDSAPVVAVAPVINTQASARSSEKAAPVAETSIRVNVEKVDQLINLVGELVITQAMLAESAAGIDGALSEKLQAGLHQLERNTRDLQEVIMSVRMLPISFVFSRFPRVVRDLAGKLGKQVELKTLGEGTELDKGLIEKIADPLTHLVRNSLDHGIESPEKRLEKGKPAKGTITLKASHQGGSIVIDVSDDGGGLNRAKILAKAKERGMTIREDISDAEVWMLIFEAGFSTADVVSDVSGRGVGMDVVKRNIAAMGGRVDIESVEGIGSRTSIRLPLTLAILDGLSVGVGEQTYIIPLAYIIESLQMAEGDMRTVSGGGHLVHVRGEYLPVVALHELFRLPRSTAINSHIVVIVESDGKKIALLVDELIGQHQVVIKSLESNFRKLPGISGATIMGDGKVAMILDVSVLCQAPSRHNSLVA